MEKPDIAKIGVFRKRYEKTVTNKLRFGCASLVIIGIAGVFFAMSITKLITPTKLEIFDFIGVIIFFIVGCLILAVYAYIFHLVFFKHKYKLDIHENGFAYYVKEKTIITTWEEVEAVSILTNGRRIKTNRNEIVSVIGNQQEIEELNKLLNEKVSERLLKIIWNKIITGSKVNFGTNHGPDSLVSDLSKGLFGEVGFEVDSNGVYGIADDTESLEFIRWTEVSNFGIVEIRGITHFFVQNSTRNLWHPLELIDNPDILQQICAEFTKTTLRQ